MNVTLLVLRRIDVVLRLMKDSAETDKSSAETYELLF